MSDTEIREALKLATRYAIGCFPALSGEHEDVAQEVVLRLHTKGVALNRALLFTCTRNECIDRLRRCKPDVSLDTIDKPWDGLDDQVQARIRLERAMAIPLPASHERGRVAVLLGLTERQLAEATGRSISAAKKSIFMAKRRVAEQVA